MECQCARDDEYHRRTRKEEIGEIEKRYIQNITVYAYVWICYVAR